MVEEIRGADRLGELRDHFDVDGVRSIGGFEGEEALGLFADLVEVFVSDTPRRVEAMRDALTRNDLEVLRNEAHSIKGSSRNVCAVTLGNLCEELETLARRGARPQELSAQFQKLQSEYHALSESVQPFLPQA